jgi:RHS repeat-associated protein
VKRKRYRYTGKEKDEESGLYYHGARYYAAWLGRWTAADPIGVGDGVNVYAYVQGNPVRLVDPSGMGSEKPVPVPSSGGGASSSSASMPSASSEMMEVPVPLTPTVWSDGKKPSSFSEADLAAYAKEKQGRLFEPNATLGVDPASLPKKGPKPRATGAEALKEYASGNGEGRASLSEGQLSFREKVSNAGLIANFTVGMVYDVINDAYIVAQKVSGSGDDTYDLAGYHVNTNEGLDALSNTMAAVLPAAKAGKAIKASDDVVENGAKYGDDFVSWGDEIGDGARMVDQPLKQADEGVDLFRAVSKAELDDIALNGLRMGEKGYETGKLFATSLEDAAQFGRYNFQLDKVPNQLIKVKVPKKRWVRQQNL